MRTSALALFAIGFLAANTLANPIEARKTVCKDVSTAQCCSVSALGVANLDCESPSKSHSTVRKFKKECSKGGKEAACCVLPLAGDGLICVAP